MGNKQSLNPSIPLFKHSEWEQCQTPQSQHSQYGWYRTLTNIQTNELIDQFQVIYSEQQDYHFYLDSFIWRLNQPGIVQTVCLQQNHRQEFCAMTYVCKVYIQHINTRLSDITDIPYPQNIYVSLAVLEGYKKLYSNLHYFKVEQNQICVDDKGHVRVWVNSDLSKNYPNIHDQLQEGDESLMVQQIMNIIFENTDKQSQPEQLRQYFFEEGQRISFDRAQKIINQYARKHSTIIPTCFQSILQIYRKDQQPQSVFNFQQEDQKLQKINYPIKQIPKEQPEKKYNPPSYLNPLPLNSQPLIHFIPYHINNPYLPNTSNPLGFLPTYNQNIKPQPQFIRYAQISHPKVKTLSRNQTQPLLYQSPPRLIQQIQIPIHQQQINRSQKGSPNKSPKILTRLELQLKPQNPLLYVLPSINEDFRQGISHSQKASQTLYQKEQNGQTSSKLILQTKSSKQMHQYNKNFPLVKNAKNNGSGLKSQIKDDKEEWGNKLRGYQQKTIYYTADSEELLDPEIAADLKIMYSQL